MCRRCGILVLVQTQPVYYSVVYWLEHNQYTTLKLIIFNCYVVTATQLAIFVPLCSCNNNIALKMAARAAKTCW